MKTLFGAIVVDGRGKLGGHVASKKQAMVATLELR